MFNMFQIKNLIFFIMILILIQVMINNSLIKEDQILHKIKVKIKFIFNHQNLRIFF